MPLKFTTTDQATEHINLLVYGEAGIGKTTLCGTAPRPLIVSAEGGTLSLADKKIPMVKIKTRDDCNDVYDYLTIGDGPKHFDTINFDSLSEVAEVLLLDEKKINKDGRAAYGVMADEMNTLVRGFRDLPYHTVFTCKSKKLVEEATGVISYIPYVPGQAFLNNLPYLFDELVRMNFTVVGTTKYRVLETVGDRRFIAKDRSGRLLPMEKPDLTYLFAKILGKEFTESAKSDSTPTHLKGK